MVRGAASADRTYGLKGLNSDQQELVVGVGAFLAGAFAVRSKEIWGVLTKLAVVNEKSILPALEIVECHRTPSAISSLIDAVETSHPHGLTTIENARGHKWLLQDGYARVPVHKEGASWWHDPSENVTWIKTSHYLESRTDHGSFFRTYKNGGVQIRFGNGFEFYESNFPKRRKIVLRESGQDCRAHQQGILSAGVSDL